MTRYGFSCLVCGDNISFPNKFIRNMLKMLNIPFVSEWKDSWTEGKRYDVKFEKEGQNILVEMDGGFHKRETQYKTLKTNQETDRLKDELAKKTNCTITGSGYQDAFWGNLITTIAGATHNVKKIKGSSSYNVEDYGIALAQAHGAGLTLEEFDQKIAAVDRIPDEERQKIIEEGNYQPSYMWNVNGWLCDKLKLTVKSQTQKCIPQTYKEDIYSSTLNMTVSKGMATGMSAIVTTTTEEGITIETECIGKVYAKEEFDSNKWTVYGEPDTNLVIDKPQTVELTCATVVNRIPDVLSANPGFIPTSQMGELKYRAN